MPDPHHLISTNCWSLQRAYTYFLHPVHSYNDACGIRLQIACVSNQASLLYKFMLTQLCNCPASTRARIAMKRHSFEKMRSIVIWMGFLLIFVVLCGSFADARKPRRPSSIHFYMRDTLQNKTKSLNTAYMVAAPNSNLTGLKFGAVIVFDDPLTEGPDLTSKRVGRGQGTYMYDNMYTGFSALLGFSAIIDTPHYNGTINFFGADRLTLPTREISVVGGTGDFELARGIATITTNSIVGDTFIIHCNVRLYY